MDKVYVRKTGGCFSSCFGFIGGLVLIGLLIALAKWLVSTPIGLVILSIVAVGVVVIVWAFVSVKLDQKREPLCKAAYEEGARDGAKAKERIESGEISGHRFVVTRLKPKVAVAYAQGVHSVWPEAEVKRLIDKNRYKELT